MAVLFGILSGMPRHPRAEYPGAIGHVMSRGERQDAIYLNDVDRQDFLKTQAEACQKTGWQVHAYCLTIRQIAERLSMGSWKSFNNTLYLLGKERNAKQK